MCDEFPLTDKVEGTSSFADDFVKKGIQDSLGRSLREFDLQTRIFKYPCSYLIYSPAFDKLPDEVRVPILQRLAEILTGEDDTDRFSHLSRSDRQAILEILRETKPEFSKVVDSLSEQAN